MSLFGRWQRGHLRLRPDDQLNLRQDFDEDLPICPDSRLNILTPLRKLCFACGEQLLYQIAERLSQRGIRNLTLLLIELPRNEIAGLTLNRLARLVDEGGLAAPRAAGESDHFRLACDQHAFECLQQNLQLRVPPVQFTRNLHRIRDVRLRQWKGVDLRA